MGVSESSFRASGQPSMDGLVARARHPGAVGRFHRTPPMLLVGWRSLDNDVIAAV